MGRALTTRPLDLAVQEATARVEEARHEVEDASNSLEIIIKKTENSHAR